MSLIGEERKNTIMDILDVREKVTVSYLADKLQVTTETIRKYLNELEQDNKVKKVYGGAIIVRDVSEEPSYLKREILYYEEKKRVGRKAAELVQDHDVIAIDEGSTPLQMIRYLTERRGLTVFTNSFPVVSALHEYAEQNRFDGNVIFLGGKVSLKHMRVYGRLAEQTMESFNIDKAFVSIDGLSPEHGLSCFDSEKGLLSSKMIERAREAYVVTDSSKFGVRGLYRMGDLSQLHGVVCEVEPPAEWQAELNARGVRWIVGGETT